MTQRTQVLLFNPRQIHANSDRYLKQVRLVIPSQYDFPQFIIVRICPKMIEKPSSNFCKRIIPEVRVLERATEEPLSRGLAYPIFV